ATVEVQPLPKPPQVVSETLVGECQFKNARRSSRVDNECKATMDDISLRLQREPNSKLIVVGYANGEEKGDAEKLAALRAINTKNYLTKGEGKQQIDAGRIEVRRASSDQGKAEFYFLPEGATFTKSDTVVVDESQFQGKHGGGK
ncbi:MAG TPA: OmpA family protein, partial [Terriglobales bacterium]|nr:OmpA family protein [Terriglobales bacterium]